MKKSKKRRSTDRLTNSEEPKPRQASLVWLVYFFMFIFLVALAGIWVCDWVKAPGLVSSFFAPLLVTALGLGGAVCCYLSIRDQRPIYGSLNLWGVLRFGSGVLTRKGTPIRYWIWMSIGAIVVIAVTAFGIFLFVIGALHH
jgi:hypothetical protein